MDEIKATLREIQTDLTEVKVSQARMEQDVAYHIKRSDQADEAIKLLRDQVDPIKTHVNRVEGVFKFLGAGSAIAAVIKLLGLI